MRIRDVGIYSLITICTIVGAEVLARSFDWAPPARDASSGDSLGMARYYHSPIGAGDLVPNQDGHWVIWFHRPYHVQTNSLGLRNTEEPIAGAFQIVALGDSQTFGPYLANEDTWPAWTENYLRQRSGTSPVQVFNAGIAGYTILDELALLREKGHSLKPSLVLLAVFENDLFDLQKERNGRVQRPSGDTMSRLETTLKVVARNSALVNLAERVKSQAQLAMANVDIRRGEGDQAINRHQLVDDAHYVARYRQLFRDMTALLKERSIPLAVIFIPAADAAGTRQPSVMEPLIRTLTSEEGVPYLDLSPVFAAEPEPEARFFLLQRDSRSKSYVGNGHLSREGNERIGREVSRWLSAERLIPQ
jgi:lysophospholipase L1-like esterase